MISVLRLFHRRERDKRVTTHCALVSRAFGADNIIVTGDPDESLMENIDSVTKRFGGKFKYEHRDDWRGVMKSFKGIKVHLTMYGIHVQDMIDKVRGKDVLIVVGGEKVPPDVYKMADYNVSVTNQPHSEIAALAIFLDRYLNGRELSDDFEGGKIKIHPSARGKNVTTNLNKEKPLQSTTDGESP